MPPYPADIDDRRLNHGLMKADGRRAVKDYRRPLKIAQPFKAGFNAHARNSVPSGTAEPFVPSGLGIFCVAKPTAEAVGYFQMSLLRSWEHFGAVGSTKISPLNGAGPRVRRGARLKKRQRTGALQDASRNSCVAGLRGSVLECGGPPPLFTACRKLCQQIFLTAQRSAG